MQEGTSIFLTKCSPGPGSRCPGETSSAPNLCLAQQDVHPWEQNKALTQQALPARQLSGSPRSHKHRRQPSSNGQTPGCGASAEKQIRVLEKQSCCPSLVLPSSICCAEARCSCKQQANSHGQSRNPFKTTDKWQPQVKAKVHLSKTILL